jgi:hypothetical protein
MSGGLRWPVVSALLLPVALSSCGGKGNTPDIFLQLQTVPQPGFQYEGSGGCQDITVYASNHNGTELLVVWADKRILGAEARPKTFDLAETPEQTLSVAVDIYPHKPKHFPYCTDIYDPENEHRVRWTARSGKITISVAKPEAGAANPNRTYRAMMKLENVTFEDERGNRVMCPNTITIEATVGWLPG